MRPASPEERRLLRDTLHRFVRRELWQQEKRLESNAFALPADVSATLSAKVESMGLALLREPEALGGPPLDGATRALLIEELSQHRAGVLAPGYGLFGPEVPPALYGATPEQQQRFLLPLLRGQRRCFTALHEPWADAAQDGIRIRARRTAEGWMLDGTKLFVAGAGPNAGGADFGVVHARAESETGEPLGAVRLLVETTRVGFQRWRPYPTLAVGRDTQELNLSNLRLPAENQLASNDAATAAHTRHDIFVAAQLAGVGRAALAIMRARLRSAPIGGSAEADRWALADCDVALSAASAFTQAVAISAPWAAQEASDEDTDATRAPAAPWGAEQVAGARLAVQDAAGRAVDAAITAMGPAGVSTDLPLERWWRELRVMRESDGGPARLRAATADRLLTDFGP
ncbi:MAG: acyl-CoA dehydrogenase [Chloroflexi bacterium]|nr:MAG: acyl-CoA dehydrogenase [Chloroflexota bacterium]